MNENKHFQNPFEITLKKMKDYPNDKLINNPLKQFPVQMSSFKFGAFFHRLQKVFFSLECTAKNVSGQCLDSERLNAAVAMVTIAL